MARKAKPEEQQAAIEVGSLPVKYRPTKFSSLVGQEAAVNIVKGMASRKRLTQAYLLTGESGCGKTTMARILARYFNCTAKTDDHEPCGVCPSCKIEKTPDVEEMNMASSRGIDDVRALAEMAESNPMFSNYRVFILDEVHMLTTQAANALLKVIEEPPPRTLFFLATTNPEKVLKTIRGRCTLLNMKPVDPAPMSKRLKAIARREGVDLSADDGAKLIRAICTLSAGRMRDAVSMLDSALSSMAAGSSDPKEALSELLSGDDASQEQAAADFLYGITTGKIAISLRAVLTVPETRALVQKLRWVVDYYLMVAAEVDTAWVPYAARLYERRTKGKKPDDIALLVRVQSALCRAEVNFNQVSIKESVLLSAELADLFKA